MLTRCNIHDLENTRTPSIIFELSRMAGSRPNFKIFVLLRRCASISYIFGPILWNFYSRVNFMTFLGILSDIFVYGSNFQTVLDPLPDIFVLRWISWHFWAYYLTFWSITWYLCSWIIFLIFFGLTSGIFVPGSISWHFWLIICHFWTHFLTFLFAGKISSIFQKFSDIFTRGHFQEYLKWRNEIFQVNV